MCSDRLIAELQLIWFKCTKYSIIKYLIKFNVSLYPVDWTVRIHCA